MSVSVTILSRRILLNTFRSVDSSVAPFHFLYPLEFHFLGEFHQKPIFQSYGISSVFKIFPNTLMKHRSHNLLPGVTIISVYSGSSTPFVTDIQERSVSLHGIPHSVSCFTYRSKFVQCLDQNRSEHCPERLFRAFRPESRFCFVCSSVTFFVVVVLFCFCFLCVGFFVFFW